MNDIKSNPLFFYSASVAALMGVVYLGVYWSSFYVNPFPALTPFKILGYIALPFLSSTLSFYLMKILLYLGDLNEAKDLHDAPVPSKAATTSRTSSGALVALRIQIGWIVAILTLIGIVNRTATILISSGPYHAMLDGFHINSYGFLIGMSVLSVALLGRAQSTRHQALLYLLLISFLIALAGFKALYDARQVWIGKSNVTVDFLASSGATSGEYGYIGELGGWIYSLDTPESLTYSDKRVMAIAKSTVASIQAPPQRLLRSQFTFRP